jgi:hypothetical protein
MILEVMATFRARSKMSKTQFLPRANVQLYYPEKSMQRSELRHDLAMSCARWPGSPSAGRTGRYSLLSSYTEKEHLLESAHYHSQNTIASVEFKEY